MLLIIMLTLLTGCGANRSYNEDAIPQPEAAPYNSSDSAKAVSYQEADSETGNGPENAGRIIIRNATLKIVVDKPDLAAGDIADMAQSMGGFLVDSNVYKTSTSNDNLVPEAEITIRIPAEKLDEALEKIKSMLKDPEADVLYQNISGQDVTMEYTDLKSRLRNLEATQDQLNKFLKESKTTEEAMLVYHELVGINEQIEVIKGNIKYYDESARLSAISITIKATEMIKPISVAGWQPIGIARDALLALITAFKGLVNIIIYLVILVFPIGILIYFLFRFFIWTIRKIFKIQPRKPKNQPQVPAAPPAKPE